MGPLNYAISRSRETKHSRNQSGSALAASLAAALDAMCSRVEKLKQAGDDAAAHRELQAFIAKFTASKVGPVATPDDLTRLSHHLAYRILPAWVYQDLGQFLLLWNEGVPTSVYMAIFGAIYGKRRLTPQQIAAFECQSGLLTDKVHYYLISYPPPPASGTIFSAEDILNMPPEKCPVLGPYFTAVLDDTENQTMHYFNLGQAPVEGTTLRVITPDGLNCNCGPGPRPYAEDFLNRLREEFLRDR